MGLSFYIRGFCDDLSLMWLLGLIILVLKGRSSGPSVQAVARETRRGVPCREAKQAPSRAERGEWNPGVGRRGFRYAAAHVSGNCSLPGLDEPTRAARPARSHSLATSWLSCVSMRRLSLFAGSIRRVCEPAACIPQAL